MGTVASSTVWYCSRTTRQDDKAGVGAVALHAPGPHEGRALVRSLLDHLRAEQSSMKISMNWIAQSQAAPPRTAIILKSLQRGTFSNSVVIRLLTQQLRQLPALTDRSTIVSKQRRQARPGTLFHGPNCET